MSDSAKYQFLPWARRGMSGYINEADTLGKSSGNALERASVRLSVEINGDPGLSEGTDLQMIGPGDIVGIKADMVVRTEPLNNVAGFEPNYLPYVEFYDEDFPWRYTPAKAVDAAQGVMDNGNLRPWLALIVLKATEFEDTQRRQPLASIIVSNPDALQPQDQLHLWAHGHSNHNMELNADTPFEQFLKKLEEKYKTDPDGLYSRIICPRRLDPDVLYHAFLVPSYETGRLAGLGRSIKGVKAQQPSWGLGARELEFPVYYRWSFRTGANFDFESLVRLLEPRIMDDRVGTRPMDCSSPGYVQKDNTEEVTGVVDPVMYLEGALVAPQTGHRPDPFNTGQAFVEQLSELIKLNKSNIQHMGDEDPVVTVPFYGMYHAMTVLSELPDFDASQQTNGAGKSITPWQNELNRDPRWRVAAGFGTRMVQENQEKFMDSAWKQLKTVLEANKKIKSAQFNAQVAEKMFAKHFEPLTQEKMLSLTRAVSGRIGAAATGSRAISISNPGGNIRFPTKLTVKSAVKSSPLPQAALSHPFRRALRSNSKMLRRLAKSENQLDVFRPKGLSFEGFTARIHRSVTQGLNAGAITAAPVVRFAPVAALPGTFAVPSSLEKVRVWSIKSNTDADFIYNLPDFMGGLPDAQYWQYIFGPEATNPAVFEGVSPADIFIGGQTELSGSFNLGGFGGGIGGGIGGGTGGGIGGGLGETGGGIGGGIGVVPRSLNAEPDFSFAYLSTNVRRDFKLQPVTPTPAALDSLADSTKVSLKPRETFTNLLRHAVRFGSVHNSHDGGFLPVMAYPDFADPAYEFLLKIDKELLLPNVDLIPPNTLSLLRTNQKFIESYLVGLNHEMGRELLWREYPTDMRGSYFRQFWDVRGIVSPYNDDIALGAEKAKDIKPIHTWLSDPNKEKWPLGKHNAQDDQGDESQLVFVVRGELLKKYPNTVIFAQKAKMDGPKKVIVEDPVMGTDIIFPKYKAEIDPDIKLYGFDLTIEEAAGTAPGSAPGWFFIIAEVPGEPRFGMDLTFNNEGTKDWNDISWQNFGTAPLDFIRAERVPGNTADGQAFNTPPGLNGPKGHWARSSADMATILFQRPVMIATHATEMLDRDILNDNLPLSDPGNDWDNHPKDKFTLGSFTNKAMENFKKS